MQSLYAFQSKKNISISVAEKEMLSHIQDIVNLKLSIISLFLFIYEHADNFFEKNKNKFLPKEEDINPNKKLINNLFYKFFFSDKQLIKRLKKFSSFWNENDHDIIRKIFTEVFNDVLVAWKTRVLVLVLESQLKRINPLMIFR